MDKEKMKLADIVLNIRKRQNPWIDSKNIFDKMKDLIKNSGIVVITTPQMRDEIWQKTMK